MNVEELITELQCYDGDLEVLVDTDIGLYTADTVMLMTGISSTKVVIG